MASPEETLINLNKSLAGKRRQGEIVTITYSGRPSMKILSLEPLAYERYGSFRNRGPHLVGKFALNCFLWSSTEHETLSPYCVFEVPSNGLFGANVDAQVLNALATEIFGEPKEYFSAVE